MECVDCRLLQLRHTVDPKLMYKEGYGYASGVNETMVDHLSDLVDEVASRYDVSPGDCVLDIASNDGTLLKAWGRYGVERTGVDPIASNVPGCEIVKDYFTGWWPKDFFKVVTSVAVLYDIDDPTDFAQRVAHTLRPDGVWVVEVQYAGEIFAGKWDQICHEHLCYYGLSQLINLAHVAGLWFDGASLNESNGGTLRAYFTKAIPLGKARGYGLVHEESSTGVWDTAQIRGLIGESAEQIAMAVRTFKRPHVLGASTKGNVILQVAKLGKNDIVAALDRNPTKVGRVLPGSGIPIIDDMRTVDADAFLVLPYHFKRSIVKRHGPHTYIWPLPKVVVQCA